MLCDTPQNNKKKKKRGVKNNNNAKFRKRVSRAMQCEERKKLETESMKIRMRKTREGQSEEKRLELNMKKREK